MPHFDDNKTLRYFIAAAERRTLPTFLKKARTTIGQEYSDFLDVVSRNPDLSIYGYNKLPGHRDHEPIPVEQAEAFQEYLINNHAIEAASDPICPPFAYLTLTKLYAIAAGGSLISPDLFDFICDRFEDRGYEPQISLGNSYSSGDVIPAAKWAKAVLAGEKSHDLRAGEGMALINGSFVHLGVGVWTLKRLDDVFARFLVGTQFFFRHVSADDAFFEYPHTKERAVTSEAVRFVSEFGFPPKDDKPQAPVSVRSTPQILDGAITALRDVAYELSYYLSKPSGNPQLRSGLKGEMHVVPSGSFLVPSLALAQGKLIDALLMLSFYVQRRLEYFLSGKVINIPKDGASDDDPIRLIQWPKLIAARVERARMRYGRRTFGSVAITSYGIEDFSTNGTFLSQDLFELTDLFSEIIDLEYTAMRSASDQTTPDRDAATALLDTAAESVPDSLRVTR